MIDYELLGGLLGSAWHDTHPERTEKNGYQHTDRMRVIIAQLNMLNIDSTQAESKLLLPMLYTMQGKCYNCGVETDTRWSSGVYCCPTCAVNKPGVIVKQGESNG